MALELNGTTGVSLVQDGVVTAADLASGAITANALPAGSVLQVVSNTSNTTESTTLTTYSELASISASITPSSTSSKILVNLSVGVHGDSDQDGHDVGVQIKLTQTISGTETTVRESNGVGAGRGGQMSIMTTDIQALVSPNTTSAVTFKFYYRRTSGNRNLYVNSNRLATLILQEIAG